MKSVCQPVQPFNCPKFHFHRWFNMVKVVKYILDVDVEQQVDGSLVPDLLRFKSVALWSLCSLHALTKLKIQKPL